MKFLYFTDSHIRSTNPKSRKDNFYQTLIDKFKEVGEICKREKVDFVIHGGDLFDRPDTSIAISTVFAQLIKGFGVPSYIVSGNHDIFGHNPKTIPRTMMGLLSGLGVFELINDKKIIIEKYGQKIQITGNPYDYNIDEKSQIDRYKVLDRADDIDYAIHVVHGFLLDKPFMPGVNSTLIEDILDTKADITLAGHYHLGFKTKIFDGKYFINPGAIVRTSNSQLELDRIPKVIIAELEDEIKIKEVHLKCALPGDKVLDRESMMNHRGKRARLVEFQDLVETSQNFKKFHILDLVDEILKTDIYTDEVKMETLRRIEMAQEEEANLS
ncbi:metallophosphoesterase [Peptoniphilus sp. GNH]|nr:Ser/Thr phosphatase family protein [Clostridiales bacterium KA00134]UHR03097.1 metallophosphoesterase [Peptoniphilus sp. GNH]